MHGNAAHRLPLIMWILQHTKLGNSFRVPEITDYELRRELILNGFKRSIVNLDQLKIALGYIPLSTEIMMSAAMLWAQARKLGRKTAHDWALDGDIILCAQTIALQHAHPDDSVIVATTNVGHLARFVTAHLWRNISPR